MADGQLEFPFNTHATSSYLPSFKSSLRLREKVDTMLQYAIEGKLAKKTRTTSEWKPIMPGLDQQDHKQIPMDWWFEDICMLDMDYFVRTITAIKAKGVGSDMIAAVICQYAMKWLPGLAQEKLTSAHLLENHEDGKEIVDIFENTGSGSSNATQRRHRFILETLVSILPAERDVVPCSFLLRLLRLAKIVEADSLYTSELEKRVGFQLEQASVTDLLIPSFSHTSDTLFDVQLLYRILKCFLSQDEPDSAIHGAKPKPPGAAQKVAKLLDCYLAEIAHDANLSVSNFEALAEVLPYYYRTSDDGLYRAVDTYLKSHPGISDTERKRLCRLMDCNRLSTDARMHAAQNERLPIRTVVQVLFCEQMRIRNGKTLESSITTPLQCPVHGFDKEQCSSQRQSEMHEIRSVYYEIHKMREDFAKLQKFCLVMQKQVEKLSKQKNGYPWSSGWKKITKTFGSQLYSSDSTNTAQRDDQCSGEEDFAVQVPRRQKWRRNSVS